MTTYKVGYLVGSLAKASINRKLARALVRLAPAALTLTEISFADLPLYSYDFDADYPPVARTFKGAIASVDAVLFVTPEYNRSIPGGLKNAIDWASRPYGDSAWFGKQAAIMGASSGRMGTARAQYHLRQSFVFLQIDAINNPEVMVANADDHFDAQGNLTHETSRKLIRQLLEALTERIHLVRSAR